MRSPEEKIRQLLNDFGRSLFEAAGTSSEINQTVHKIRQEGFSVYVVLARMIEPDDADPVCRQRDAALAPVRRPEPVGPPAFRLNGDDVAFLRSLGIDPTRSPRRRRSSPA